jgi:hypothetical protein
MEEDKEEEEFVPEELWRHRFENRASGVSRIGMYTDVAAAVYDEWIPENDAIDEDKESDDDQWLHEDDLPNPIMQARSQYSREAARMLRHRHGPLEPAWIPSSSPCKTYIECKDQNETEEFSLSTELGDNVAIVRLNVGIDDGHWSWECRISEPFEGFAVGWMIANNKIEEENENENDFSKTQAYVCGDLNCAQFSASAPIPKSLADCVSLGFTFNEFKLDFLCDGEIFFSCEAPPSKLAYPCIFSGNRNNHFVCNFDEAGWRFPLNGLSIASSYFESCPVVLFSKLRGIHQNNVPNPLPSDFDDSDWNLFFHRFCYFVETAEIIHQLHSQYSKLDIEIFRYYLHQFVCKFSRKNMSVSCPHSQLPTSLSTFLVLISDSTSDEKRDLVDFQLQLDEFMCSIPQDPSPLIKYVSALRMPIVADETRVHRYLRLKKCFEEFLSVAEYAVAKIVDELDLSKKTIPEVPGFGGVAGGSKFLHR